MDFDALSIDRRMGRTRDGERKKKKKQNRKYNNLFEYENVVFCSYVLCQNTRFINVWFINSHIHRVERALSWGIIRWCCACPLAISFSDGMGSINKYAPCIGINQYSVRWCSQQNAPANVLAKWKWKLKLNENIKIGPKQSVAMVKHLQTGKT